MIGQVSDVSVKGTTPTQAVVAYTAPTDDACVILVSESSSLAPPVHDIDPALFAGANLDSRSGNANDGRRRVFVIGKRTAEIAASGKRVSRALQVSTPHFFRISCGSAEATGTFTTANLAPGKAYPEIPLVDPNNPGEYSWPDMPYGDPSPQMIDPLSGILFRPLSKPREKHGLLAIRIPDQPLQFATIAGRIPLRHRRFPLLDRSQIRGEPIPGAVWHQYVLFAWWRRPWRNIVWRGLRDVHP
jgi:hypothetical protein